MNWVGLLLFLRKTLGILTDTNMFFRLTGCIECFTATTSKQRCVLGGARRKAVGSHCRVYQCMWQGWSGDLLPCKSGFTHHRTMERHHGEYPKWETATCWASVCGPTSGPVWPRAAPSRPSPGRHLPSWAPIMAQLGSFGRLGAVKNLDLGKCCLVTSQSPKLQNCPRRARSSSFLIWTGSLLPFRVICAKSFHLPSSTSYLFICLPFSSTHFQYDALLRSASFQPSVSSQGKQIRRPGVWVVPSGFGPDWPRGVPAPSPRFLIVPSFSYHPFRLNS